VLRKRRFRCLNSRAETALQFTSVAGALFVSPALTLKENQILTTDHEQALPSERSFGLLFGAVFALLAGYGWLFKGWSLVIVLALVAVALAFLLLGFVAPRVLRPLNWLWFQLGQLLGKVVSPVVLGAIFFLILTPVSLLTRLFGRDELRLKRKASQTSYWLDRVPPGPEPESFKNQF
jgi:hypothetical protein